MRAVDYGFSASSCHSCKFAPDEKIELINGKPQCLSEDRPHCKHFNSIKKGDLIREGLVGNPMNFLSAGGLFKFEILSSKLASLSGLDGQGLQTYDFYSSLAGKSDIEEESLQSILAIKLSYIRNRQIEEKIKAMNRKG